MIESIDEYRWDHRRLQLTDQRKKRKNEINLIDEYNKYTMIYVWNDKLNTLISHYP